VQPLFGLSYKIELYLLVSEKFSVPPTLQKDRVAPINQLCLVKCLIQGRTQLIFVQLRNVNIQLYFRMPKHTVYKIYLEIACFWSQETLYYCSTCLRLGMLCITRFVHFFLTTLTWTNTIDWSFHTKSLLYLLAHVGYMTNPNQRRTRKQILHFKNSNLNSKLLHIFAELENYLYSKWMIIDYHSKNI